MFRIMFPNLFDTLNDLAASSEVATLPVTNLQRQERVRIWRTEDTSDASITGNLPAVHAVNGFALVRHNLSVLATVRLRLFSGLNQTGTTLYDSGAIELGEDAGYGESDYGLFDYGGSSVFLAEGYRFFPLYFDSAGVEVALSMQIDISDPDNPDGHFEAVRAVLSEYIEIEYDASKGSGWAWEDPSRSMRSAGGSLRTQRVEKYRQWDIRMGLLSEIDHAALFDLSGKAGMSKDMFISAHPDEGGTKERNASGLVKIVQLPKMNSRTDGHEQYESTMVFQES